AERLFLRLRLVRWRGESKESVARRKLRRRRGLRGLKTVVPYGATGRQAGVNDGGPALQAMVMRTMKEIGGGDRHRHAPRLDRGDRRVVVHDVVGQEQLVAAAAPHVQS